MADDTGQGASQDTNLGTVVGDGTTVRKETPPAGGGEPQPQPGQQAGAGATTEGGKGEPKAAGQTGQSSLLGGGAEEGEPQLKPWMTALPADLKGNAQHVKALSGFDSQNDVVRAYLDGRPAVTVQELIAAASDEDKAKLWEAIGRPSSANGYSLKMDLPKDIPVEATMLEGFKQVVYDAGLNNAQAQSVVDFYNRTMVEAFNRQSRLVQRSVMEAERQLRTEWRDEYPTKIEKAKRAAQEVFSVNTMKKINSLGLGRDPDFLKDVAGISDRIFEDTLETTDTEPSKDRTPGRFHYPSMESGE